MEWKSAGISHFSVWFYGNLHGPTGDRLFRSHSMWVVRIVVPSVRHRHRPADLAGDSPPGLYFVEVNRRFPHSHRAVEVQDPSMGRHVMAHELDWCRITGGCVMLAMHGTHGTIPPRIAISFSLLPGP
jgi:hypothetical protein